MNLSDPFTIFIILLGGLSTIMSVVNGFTKSGKNQTDVLVRRMHELSLVIAKLQETDAEQQRQLNHKEFEIKELKDKNIQQDQELSVYKEILENRSPKLVETLERLEKSSKEVFDKITEWEVIVNESEIRAKID